MAANSFGYGERERVARNRIEIAFGGRQMLLAMETVGRGGNCDDKDRDPFFFIQYIFFIFYF